jgi:hypothetical protein
VDAYLTWTVLLLLAVLMGFVAERTNLCSVEAVDEIMTQRRATLLWSFAKISLWVLGVLLLLEYFFQVPTDHLRRFEPGITGLIGGMIFGVGAVLNGGCSLRMLTRLGRGDLQMVIAITGMPVGAMIVRALLLELPEAAPALAAQPMVADPFLRQLLLLLVGVWMLQELLRLLASFRFSKFRERLLAERYQPASSAALLGIANGFLFAFVGTWMFTYTLIQGMSNLLYGDSSYYMVISPFVWVLLGAYMLGIFLSALQAHHLVFQTPGRSWFRYFVGGVLMGLGATLVPGGNDMLILNGIPGLSAHGLPAYLAMMVGIAIALVIIKRMTPAQEA